MGTPGMLTIRFSLKSRTCQSIQDTTILGAPDAGTAAFKRTQLYLKLLEFRDAPGDMVDVLINDGTNTIATGIRPVPVVQQQSDLIQGHVERAAVLDETQPFKM